MTEREIHALLIQAAQLFGKLEATLDAMNTAIRRLTARDLIDPIIADATLSGPAKWILVALALYGPLLQADVVRRTGLNFRTVRKWLMILEHRGRIRALESEGAIYYVLS